MTLFEIFYEKLVLGLGWDPEAMVMCIKEKIESLNKALQGTKDVQLIEIFKHDTVSKSNFIAIRYYLVDNKKGAENYAHPLLDYAIEYFFGQWRNEVPYDGKIGVHYWKRSLWVDEFREAILWGSCLGEWEKVKCIAQYPDDDCYTGTTAIYTGEIQAWYLVLAAVLRGDTLDTVSKYCKVIETGKKKREKLLLKVLRPLLKGDMDIANQEFAVYLKYYKRFEFPKKLVPETLAIDGTFLINYARYLGYELQYPAEYEDHIVKLD
jgi:hypothetical protein